MKKFLLFSALLIISGQVRAEVYDYNSSLGLNIEEVPSEEKLINTDNFNKKKSFKFMQQEETQKKHRKIQLDVNEINHQRALNFSTDQNDSIFLPVF